MDLVEGADKDWEIALGHPAFEGLEEAVHQEGIHGCEDMSSEDEMMQLKALWYELYMYKKETKYTKNEN